MDCDILAGERGPSYSDVSQIKDWKVLHVRFIERHSEEIVNVEGEDDESESFDRMPPSASSTAVSMQAAVSRKPESVIKSRMPNKYGQTYSTKTKQGSGHVQIGRVVY